jgi:hypothetical protein
MVVNTTTTQVDCPKSMSIVQLTTVAKEVSELLCHPMETLTKLTPRTKGVLNGLYGLSGKDVGQLALLDGLGYLPAHHDIRPDGTG